MRTIKLTLRNLETALSSAEKILKSGGIAIGPTDTVYGIFGDATNLGAVKKIFALKQRPEEKALPIFVKDIKAARRYAYISDAKAKFLKKVWPGAVTVVFHHKEKLPRVLTGGSDKIGIRIPDHPFMLELLGRLDFPLAQTSANISGRPPARNIREIRDYFTTAQAPSSLWGGIKGEGGMKPDLIIDGEKIAGQASTAIDFSGPEPIILRSGFVTKKELDSLVKSVGY